MFPNSMLFILEDSDIVAGVFETYGPLSEIKLAPCSSVPVKDPEGGYVGGLAENPGVVVELLWAEVGLQPEHRRWVEDLVEAAQLAEFEELVGE